jgi:hypothetical protein
VSNAISAKMVPGSMLFDVIKFFLRSYIVKQPLVTNLVSLRLAFSFWDSVVLFGGLCHKCPILNLWTVLFQEV